MNNRAVSKIILGFAAAAVVAVCFTVNCFAGEEMKRYVNARFGYALDYPDIFDRSEESANGDGLKFESDGGDYTLVVWGQNNIFEEGGGDLLEAALEGVSDVLPGSGRSDMGFYTLTYAADDARISHQYGIVNEELKASYILTYPRGESERFEEILKLMDASLRFTEVIPYAGT